MNLKQIGDNMETNIQKLKNTMNSQRYDTTLYSRDVLDDYVNRKEAVYVYDKEWEEYVEVTETLNRLDAIIKIMKTDIKEYLKIIEKLKGDVNEGF